MTTPARARREMPQRYRLEAGRCTDCGSISYPPRIVCRDCRSRNRETIVMSRNAKLLTYTVIRVAPGPFVDEAPYAVGIIETEEGARLTVQVVDCDFDTMKTGMDLRLEFRLVQAMGEDGIICYGHKAVPAWD
jgi:scaffold protein (connect acetoacetyl-CoA thiolase and HMG-CoA synthase)